MRKDLDEKLVSDFPLLYRDRHKPMNQTCMCWGFDHGDGWEPIIRKLSEKLEPMIVKYKQEHPEVPDDELPAASQVKEKFATLRFYMTCSTDEMEKAIDEAEKETETTCELCGNPGVLREGSWLNTLCDADAKGRKPRQKLNMIRFKTEDGITVDMQMPKKNE